MFISEDREIQALIIWAIKTAYDSNSSLPI